MRYWLTTHWPQYKDAADSTQSGIHLPDGRHQPGDNVSPGDRVLIYEAKTGRSKVITDTRGNKRSRTRRKGAQGVVVVAEVVTKVEADPRSQPEVYSDKSVIHWKWRAETKPILRNGFVSRASLNQIMGWHEDYTLRAIGQQQSGLQELTCKQYEALVREFRNNPHRNRMLRRLLEKRSKLPQRSCGGVESEAHRNLKEYFAENASAALNEPGLSKVDVEYRFATNDRADVVLEDAEGNIIGVEIEIEQGPMQLDGLLQAIKYRYMLAPSMAVPFEQTRGMLVAYSLSQEIKKACEDYDIQHVEIKRRVVAAWAANR